MKVRIVTCLSVAIALIAAVDSRAAQPSEKALSEMGLGGLSVMSDSDALAVRGLGYHSNKSTAKAWGKSWAQISSHGASAGSENAYVAEGKHSASGKNLSFAGLVIVSSNGHGGGGGMGGGGGAGVADNGGHGDNHGGHGGGVNVKAVVVFAGGSSSAKNH